MGNQVLTLPTWPEPGQRGELIAYFQQLRPRTQPSLSTIMNGLVKDQTYLAYDSLDFANCPAWVLEDEEVMTLACRLKGSFEKTCPNLRAKSSFVLAVAETGYLTVKDISFDLLLDQDFLVQLISLNQSLWDSLPTSVRGDVSLCQTLIEKGKLDPIRLVMDLKLMSEPAYFGLVAYYCPMVMVVPFYVETDNQGFRDIIYRTCHPSNPNFVGRCIYDRRNLDFNNNRAVFFAAASLVDSNLEAVTKADVLVTMEDELRDDRELALVVVSRFFRSYLSLSERLRAEPEILLATITGVPTELLTDILAKAPVQTRSALPILSYLLNRNPYFLSGLEALIKDFALKPSPETIAQLYHQGVISDLYFPAYSSALMEAKLIYLNLISQSGKKALPRLKPDYGASLADVWFQ